MEMVDYPPIWRDSFDTTQCSMNWRAWTGLSHKFGTSLEQVQVHANAFQLHKVRRPQPYGQNRRHQAESARKAVPEVTRQTAQEAKAARPKVRLEVRLLLLGQIRLLRDPLALQSPNIRC